MSLLCLLGKHRPSLSAIVRRPDGYASLCEACACSLARAADGRWKVANPARDQVGSGKVLEPLLQVSTSTSREASPTEVKNEFKGTPRALVEE
jgi:hypothetical protein